MALHFSDTPCSVLVTGATGFIGRRLVAALLADGHRVTALCRDPARALKRFDRKVECIPSLTTLSPQHSFDVIINLAGARILGPRWSDARKAILRTSRIALTEQLVAWIARAERKPALLLSASAIGYYGVQAPGDASVLTETSPPQPIFMSQLCQDWEAAAAKAEQHGVRVLRMRFGVVLGKGGALPMMLLPIKLGAGGPLGRGTQWMSWIHIDDLLAAIAHLWHSSARGALPPDGSDVYNFTAPEALSQRDFARLGARLRHRPACLPTPAFVMRALLGEQADLLLEGQRVAPAHLLARGFTFTYPDMRSALENLLPQM